MSIPTEHLDGLEALSRDGASAAHLDTAAGIRGVAAQRRRRRAVTGVAALAVAVVVVAPSVLSLAGDDSADRPSPITPPTVVDPSPEPPDGSGVDGGGAVVDIQTYAGRWVAPGVEGGVRTFRSRAASPLETGWRLEETGDGRVRIVSVSQVDGRDLCLSDAADVEHVGVELCTPRATSFEVAEVGRPGVVNIRSAHGLVGADPGVDRFLQSDTDPDSPATVFTLR